MSDNVTTTGTLEDDKNHTVEQKISRAKELILLFWVDEEDPARKMFAESAQTRMKNIKKSKWYNGDIHKVHCPPIQALHEIGPIIANWTNEYGGKDKIKTREVGVFSHSGIDGPITVLTPNVPPLVTYSGQMAIIDGWDAINFNWKERGSMCVFYGCNSGRGGKKFHSFAQNLSILGNFKNVEVWGQQNFSYPSFVPEKRATYGSRSLDFGWDIQHTYMVSAPDNTSEEAHFPFFYPDAIPMAVYMNGLKIKESHQGVFNDHRGK